MPVHAMAKLDQHVRGAASAMSLFTRRISRHPERYLEMLRIARHYELHHVAAELGMAHQHDEEDFTLDGHVAPGEREEHEKRSASSTTSRATWAGRPTGSRSVCSPAR